MGNTYSQTQLEKPYKSYIKRSMAKLYVRVLNPFTGEPDGVILTGDPRKPTPECVLEVADAREDLFLHRNNKKHFEAGELVEYTPKEEPISEEVRLNQLSDEELRQILREKFYSLKNYADKVTSVTPLFTLLRLAQEEEKSEKIINFIKSRIEELQKQEVEGLLPPDPKTTE